jgi:hypothetical protein
MGTATARYRTDFDVTVTTQALAPNLPQRVGTVLWAPMLVMALMAFPLALILAIARANLIAHGGQPAIVAALGQYVPAAMFLGFASVFAAVSFAIARILGVLRTGGGRIQEAAGRSVHTLRMPFTAKAFIGLMAMAMMILLFTVVAHVMLAGRVAAAVAAGDTAAGVMMGGWGIWLEGLRRFGAATYLFSIALGLATVFHVLGFQSTRIKELPGERRLAG